MREPLRRLIGQGQRRRPGNDGERGQCRVTAHKPGIFKVFTTGRRETLVMN